MRYCILACLVLLVLLPWISSAQQRRFQTYTVKDGLPSNGISALFQDSRDYLWIGTSNGLSVYDGTAFKNFSLPDGLPNLVITRIVESRIHPRTLWIGTIAGGIVRMSGGKVVGRPIPIDNPGDIVEDRKGRLWVSSGGRVLRIERDSIAVMQKVGAGAAAIQSRGDSVILILADGHLTYSPVDDVGSASSRDLGFASGTITSPLSVDPDGTVWFLTSAGVHQVSGDGRPILHRLDKPIVLSKDIPSGVCDDGEGTLWFTTPGGLLRFNKVTLQHHFSEMSATPGGLYGPILRDSEGNLWMGGNGLMKLSERKLYHIPLNGVSHGRYTMAACTDSNGHIWIITSKELLEVYRSNVLQWKSYAHPGTGPASLTIQGGVTMDPLGRLWKGPDPSGVYTCFEIQRQHRGPSILREVMTIAPHAPAGHQPGLVFAIDRHERGWFSLDSSGVILVDLRRKLLLGKFLQTEGLPREQLRALLVDRESNVWAGSWTTGLAMKQPSSEAFVMQQFDPLTGMGVRSLHEDRDGALWIGTRYGGLIRHRDSEFTSISVKEGLQSNSIWSLAETERRMWCGTDVGLESVGKASEVALPQKQELIGSPVIGSGAFRDEFVWSVSSNELLIFEEPDRPSASVPPRVYVKEFVVNGIVLGTEVTHTLDADKNTCSFEFVGLSFKDEAGVRYQYRMLGVDSVWSTPTKQRSVTFATLKPGVYRFEVRAINAAGIASVVPATLGFEIIPPLWQQPWFIALAIVCAASLLWLLYRYRVGRILEMERLRVRIAGDLHDDVGTNLSSILIASQIMDRQGRISEEDKVQVREIGAIAANTQEMMRDIVWMLNPGNDTLDDFLLKMREVAARLLLNIRYSFIVPEQKLLDKVGIEFKRNVFLIFKESLNNIVRHADATEAIIEVMQADGRFTLTIKDNGRGFDSDARSSGMGLHGIRRRAEQIDGVVEISSVNGAGTTVSLTAITRTRNSRIPF